MARFHDENGFALFDWDKATGRTVWYKENADGTTTWRTDYPVENIIKQNAEQRVIAGDSWKGEMHQIASIPLNIAHDGALGEAIKEQDQKWINRWLNDSDNRAFRTKEGNV
ncbi:MAG: hypothetical protein AAFW66_00105 [Pseudomonadota bacterium]